MMPSFSLDWNLPTRLTVSAFLHALRHLAPLSGNAWFPTGVLQIARDPTHLARHQRIIEQFCLPSGLMQMASARKGSELAGQRVAGPGWWMPGAGWAIPAEVCRNELIGARILFGRHVARLQRGRNETWEALDSADHVIARAPLVILANAHAAGDLLGEAGLPLAAVRGQVSLLPQPKGAGLKAPVCREGFITPAIDGLHRSSA